MAGDRRDILGFKVTDAAKVPGFVLRSPISWSSAIFLDIFSLAGE